MSAFRASLSVTCDAHPRRVPERERLDHVATITDLPGEVRLQFQGRDHFATLVLRRPDYHGVYLYLRFIPWALFGVTMFALGRAF